MNLVNVLTVVLVTLAMAVGVLLGMKLFTRTAEPTRRLNWQRVGLLGVIFAFAIAAGILIESGGTAPDALGIYVGISLWLIVMFVMIKRSPKF